MRKFYALLLAILLSLFSFATPAETLLPANMTSPEKPAPPGQAVSVTIVTAYGSQYDMTLRLDEVIYKDFSLVVLFSMTQGEVIPAEGAQAAYLEQRFGSEANSSPYEQMLLHPDFFSLITDLEDEYPLTADGFSLPGIDEFEYEPLLMASGEEIRFKLVFEFVVSLKDARIRYRDSGMHQVFMLRPDLMEDSVAWLALE